MTIDEQVRTILDPCLGCSLNDQSTKSKRKMIWRLSLCCFKNPLHLCSEIQIKAENHIGRLCPLSPLMLHEIALDLFNPLNNFLTLTPSINTFNPFSLFDITT